MRKRASIIVLTAVLLSLGARVVPLAAQSLADVARQEQERRKTIQKPSKVLTNKDLTPPPATGVSPAGTPAASGTTPAAGGAGTPGSAVAGTPAANGTAKNAGGAAKDQAYWSAQVKGLQTQLDRDQAFAVAIQSEINALTTQYTNQADPVQQAKLATDRQKAISELGRLTKQVEDDKKAIVDLQEQARREGVPSGWLR